MQGHNRKEPDDVNALIAICVFVVVVVCMSGIAGAGLELTRCIWRWLT